MLHIIKDTSHKTKSILYLENIFKTETELSGTLYLGYPIISTLDGPLCLDGLYVSDTLSLVAFDLIEDVDSDIATYRQRQDYIANLLDSKLRVCKDLTLKRKLLACINVISLALDLDGALSSTKESFIDKNNLLYTNGRELITALTSLQSISFLRDCPNNLNLPPLPYLYKKVISSLQLPPKIESKSLRHCKRKDSLGFLLQEKERALKTLDITQMKAVLETIDGIQCIRGVKGSGKSTVLA